ncbi:MAG: hypothetical protein IKX67_07785 [Bacteroidales bacterium]|nr:hypothetical protein [Bacteroidales bacterium]MBR5043126.1 hypothetical protein [Bacteroidales bacterium]
MKRFLSFAYTLLSLLLLVVLSGCRRMQLPGEEEPEGTVMLSAETKALPAGVNTFRVALFHNRQYSGRSGTYCTNTFSYTDSYTDPSNPHTYTWLKPCKVNASGEPLDNTNPGVVTTIDAADHSSIYGLRWNNGGSGWSGNAHLVAIAPAVDFVWEGHAAYLPWTIDSNVYVSDPVEGGFTGIWFRGEYVYTSSSLSEDSSLSKTLMDRRAKVTVKIQCSTDLIPSTKLFDVRVTDRIISDRFYLHEEGDHPQGFTRPLSIDNPILTEYFTVDSDPAHALVLKNSSNLPDYSDPANLNAPLAYGGDYWISADPFYVQARDYSDQWMTGKRPTIVVKLGPDPSTQFTVRVPLDQELLPMHHYLYTLDVKNAYMAYSFQAVGWDTPVLGGNTVAETPACLGTVAIGGPSSGDDDWGNGGGGTADPPVNS